MPVSNVVRVKLKTAGIFEMNAERRKEIDKARHLIVEAKEILEQAEGDEREYFDNMPESFQSGEKGQAAEAAADALQEGIDSLDAVLENLDTATE